MGFNYAGYEAAWSNAVEEIKRIPMREVLAQLGMDTGRNNMIRCFVHNDSNPSMQIRAARNGAYVYHCFACGASGSNIDLVMHVLGYDFKDSVYWLGRTFGINIPDKNFYYGEGFEHVERFPLSTDEIIALGLDPGSSQVFCPKNLGDIPNEKLNAMAEVALGEYTRSVKHEALSLLPKDTMESRPQPYGGYLYGDSCQMSLRKLWRGDNNWGTLMECRDIFFWLVCSKLTSALTEMQTLKYSGKLDKICDNLPKETDPVAVLKNLNAAVNKRMSILDDLKERLEDEYPEYVGRYMLHMYRKPTKQEILAKAQ